MNSQTLLLIASMVVSAISLALAIYAFWGVRTTQKLRANMGPGHEPENLEQILEAMIAKIKALESNHAETKADLAITTDQTGLAVKKLGLVRFNSFTDEGGNLSFCLAMLDSENNGVVLTNLHGRQQNRLYAKKVLGSVGESALNDEEQQAVMLAVTEHKTQTPKNKS
jgi:hypothetical protein